MSMNIVITNSDGRIFGAIQTPTKITYDILGCLPDTQKCLDVYIEYIKSLGWKAETYELGYVDDSGVFITETIVDDPTNEHIGLLMEFVESTKQSGGRVLIEMT